MNQKQLINEINELESKLEAYKGAMVELQRRSDIQDALNEMLNISLMPISLNKQMEKILLLVLNIPWLALDKKGCIFLTDETGKGLRMVAHSNLGKSLLDLCTHIQFGQCLCGRAAAQQNLIFKQCLDHEHDIIPEGMAPHGHYNMPIISSGKTLGVLNLYVKHGHEQSTLEVNFLDASAKAMASIIERKKAEDKLYQLSYIDELTSIANRRKFMNHLNAVIIDSLHHNQSFALLFIDLDHFKVVNDTYGHEYGDQILVDATKRMKRCLRETDLIARLGGDEFVVVLENISESEKAMQIAEQLIETVSQDYKIKEKVLSIGVSIGVSLFPEHDSNAHGLLQKADKALYQAKENRGKSILFIK